MNPEIEKLEQKLFFLQQQAPTGQNQGEISRTRKRIEELKLQAKQVTTYQPGRPAKQKSLNFKRKKRA
jgi:alpha-D-ribose 1-methylphosphonate 5-phosphate C-P lyase